MSDQTTDHLSEAVNWRRVEWELFKVKPMLRDIPGLGERLAKAAVAVLIDDPQLATYYEDKGREAAEGLAREIGQEHP